MSSVPPAQVTVGEHGKVHIADVAQHVDTDYYSPTPHNPRSCCRRVRATVSSCLKALVNGLTGFIFILFVFPSVWVSWKLKELWRICSCHRDPAVMPDNYNLSASDSHTYSMIQVVIKAHQTFVRESMSQVPVPVDGVVPIGSFSSVLREVVNVPIPTYDYGLPPKPWFVLWFINWIHQRTPFRDVNTLWRDRIQATNVVQRTFGIYLAPVFVHWSESTSDNAFRTFAFQGMACQHLMRVHSPADKLIQAQDAALRQQAVIGGGPAGTRASAGGAPAAVTAITIATAAATAAGAGATTGEGEGGDQKHAGLAEAEAAAADLGSIPHPQVAAAAAAAPEAEAEAVYVIRFNNLGAFEVRPGHQRYGGDAYFAHDGKPLYIDLHGEIVRPGDEQWEYTKFVFRSSAFIHCTLSDHLFFSHFTLSNVVASATRLHLPGEHPLHRLLAPFTYRSITINHTGSKSLVPENGILHRTSGYTYKGLMAHLTYASRRLPFYLATPRAQFARRQTDKLPGKLYPYAQDAVEFFECIAQYVREYLAIYYKDYDELKQSHGGAVVRWWAYIIDKFPFLKNEQQHQLGPLPLELTNLEQVVEMLASTVFVVSGFHQHVGVVQEYLLDPWFLSGRIIKGVACAPAQSTYQMCMVASLTGFKMPNLISPFEEYAHLFLDGDAIKAMARFQTALGALSAQIDLRNATERTQPFMSFNPRVLECSVSV